MSSQIKYEPQVGSTISGEAIDAFILGNSRGTRIKILNYGGRISSIQVPDRKGVFQNVVLGFEQPELYLSDNPYFGALVGRYANRIAGGRFELEAKSYHLKINNPPNHLHGGLVGFDKVIWNAEIQENLLRLSYLSPHMEEGYPGNLKVVVNYVLTEEDELEVSYEAQTDQTTVLNLTQHSYFNMSGNFRSDILDHEVTIRAEHFLPVDQQMIPTGEIRPVAGTNFDFRTPETIGRRIEAEDEQLKLSNGYDHTFVLKTEPSEWAAQVYHPGSGRLLQVQTTEPGMQLYTGNWLDASLPIPGGGHYRQRSGLCLETQHFPDSPNQPRFPSVVLKPAECFRSKTTFRFSVV